MIIRCAPPGWSAAKSSSAGVDDFSAQLFRETPTGSDSSVPVSVSVSIDDLPYLGYGKRVFAESDFTLEYHAREEFAGRRSGFVFRMGAQGIGYYADPGYLADLPVDETVTESE